MNSYLKLHWTDEPTATNGYLVIDRLVRGVAAGGLRISPGITPNVVAELAQNMTLKQAAVGIRVGGAKAGLDLDPASPFRDEIVRRFLEAIRPLILTCFSCGPDMNTTMAELEGIARSIDIPALKIAVARSRGIADEIFLESYRLLEERTELGTVNELRGAAGVAAAVRVLLDAIADRNSRSRVAIQGAGNMGAATARLLSSAGVAIVGWADDKTCLKNPDGLDVARLSSAIRNRRLPRCAAIAAASAAILEVPCDVLVLAAVSNAFDATAIPRLRCGGVVEAANLALDADVETELHRRGIFVVPDLVSSVGGSLAVESLYERNPRNGSDVLRHVELRMSAIVRELLDVCRGSDSTPRSIARRRAALTLGLELQE